MSNRESSTRISTQVIVDSQSTWLFFYTCLKFTALRLVYPRPKKIKIVKAAQKPPAYGFAKRSSTGD